MSNEEFDQLVEDIAKKRPKIEVSIRELHESVKTLNYHPLVVKTAENFLKKSSKAINQEDFDNINETIRRMSETQNVIDGGSFSVFVIITVIAFFVIIAIGLFIGFTS